MKSVSQLLQRKIYQIGLILFLAFSSIILPTQAKKTVSRNINTGYILVDKISDANTDSLILLINEVDLEQDPQTSNSRKIRFLLDASSLVTKTYPQTIKIKAYTKDANSKENIISIINSTILRSQEAKNYNFTLNIPLSFSSNDVLIDIYDADGLYRASFKQYIEQKPSQESHVLESIDCDDGKFGDCQMQYILNAINYQPILNRKLNAIITKENSGNYTVSLPMFRSKGSTIINQIGTGPVANENGEGSLDGLSAPEVISLVSQGDFTFDKIQLAKKEFNSDNLPADGTLEFDGKNLYLVKQGVREKIARQGEQGPPGPPGTFNSGTANIAILNLLTQTQAPSAPIEGTTYNDLSGAICVYLNGSWGKLYGTGTCPGAIDTSPDAFDFSNTANKISQLTYSDSLIIQNFTTAVISITGQGNPEYSVNSGVFTNAPSSISHGDIVRLRLTSNGTLGQSNIANITIGTHTDTWAVISSTCPENFAFIPGSSGVDSFGNVSSQYLNGWCVSQYEMTPQGTGLWVRDAAYGWHYQNSSGVGKAITAKGNGGDSFPINQITRNEAAAACANDLTLKDGTSLSNGKLLTIYFWSKIAQAIVDDGRNWSGGTPGSGNLSRGNSSGAFEAGIAESTVATQPITGVFYYAGSAGRAWRMGAGEESIYDFAGNLWEWSDDLSNITASVWNEIDATSLNYVHDNPNGVADVALIPSESLTHDNTTNGVGRIFTTNSNPYISGSAGAFIYGGDWGSGTYSGVFTTITGAGYSASITRQFNIGFRCIIPAQ